MYPDGKSDIYPFQMLGNLYFVGSRAVSVHLIDTGDGLILIDTGFPNMYQQLCASMRTLGFDPADIRMLLHSHGHYDHIGCTARLKEISGARTCISRIDNDIVNGKRDLSWAHELGFEPLPPFECDMLLEDGDVVELGSTRIQCRLAPGHTEGTLCFFLEIQDGGRRYTAAMHGGVGTNSMETAFLRKYSLPFELRDRFREGLHRLAEIPVDVVLGNHPDQNDTEGKLRRIRNGERLACVDSGEWPRFLADCERRLDKLLVSEQEA